MADPAHLKFDVTDLDQLAAETGDERLAHAAAALREIREREGRLDEPLPRCRFSMSKNFSLNRRAERHRQPDDG